MVNLQFEIKWIMDQFAMATIELFGNYDNFVISRFWWKRIYGSSQLTSCFNGRLKNEHGTTEINLLTAILSYLNYILVLKNCLKDACSERDLISFRIALW